MVRENIIRKGCGPQALVEESVIEKGLYAKELGLYSMLCLHREGNQPLDIERVDFDWVRVRSAEKKQALMVGLRGLINKGVIPAPSKRSFVYIATDASGIFKVGIHTGLCVADRMDILRTGNPTIRCYAYKRDLKARQIERAIHAELASFNVGGEWFKLTREQAAEIVRSYNFSLYPGEQNQKQTDYERERT